MSRGRLAVLALALGLAACGRDAGPKPANHLVLVTIDTLRADHVGAYGRPNAETPHLDFLAHDGAMALEASAHVPLTRPSHVTLLTGRLPSETGVRDNISPAVVGDVPLLADVLHKAGFGTGAFVSSVVLESASGLSRGFDVYDDAVAPRGAAPDFLNRVQRRGDLTTDAALAWLEKTRTASPDARVFLWLHLYDPHDPYEPPEPYAARFADRPYDGEIAFADAQLGRLEDALARFKMDADTALVVTSDHGEGLGEHGETLHGFFVYQSTLHVPLLVRAPGVRPGTRLAAPIGLIDVFPTALELLGLPEAAGLEGRSFAEALRGAPQTAAPLYAESLVPLLHFGWSDLRVMRDGRYKYIQAPRPELYDLATDPGETSDLASREAARVAALRGGLGRILDAERAHASSTGPVAISPELLENLGALGYVGGGAGPADTRTPGADPKDRIEDFRFTNEQMREGLLRLSDQDYGAAVARFDAVLKRGVSSFEVHYYLGRALLGLGRAKDAGPHFAEAARRSPAFSPAWQGLGASELGAGRKAEAVAAWAKAAELSPKSASLQAQLGDLYRELGRVDEAIRHQTAATALAPNDAAYWNSLGMTLGGNGRGAEAEHAFREAVRLDAGNARYAFNLGLILARAGRRAEARPWFEKALALDPTFSAARAELGQR